jgi:SAM-dependent methyltransferase
VKGFVATPRKIVDLMVSKLFARRGPRNDEVVLDPGCGTGSFIEGLILWCKKNGTPFPRIVGVELDPHRVLEARAKFAAFPSVAIEERDFLGPDERKYDFIIGNPPYVPITELTEREKRRYRKRYRTARGRFDLYFLFLEQAIRSLRPGGRLVFITPEKYAYVDAAAPLRRLLSAIRVEEIHFLQEDVFGELVTYPTITTVVHAPGPSGTAVIFRDGRTAKVNLPTGGASWLPALNGGLTRGSKFTLSDVCDRVSCGVATGADAVFVVREEELPAKLRPFAYPTIAGRELTSHDTEILPSHVMLIPYDRTGRLLPEGELGALGNYLNRRNAKDRLLARTCVAKKPWYAFHENPPLPDILRPKILCKDIAERPRFWVDRGGSLVPRHSVYYIVPKDPSRIDRLAQYLRSEAATRWLEAHCQRAANGFLRLQSRVLKRLPVPPRLALELAAGPRLERSPMTV